MFLMAINVQSDGYDKYLDLIAAYYTHELKYHNVPQPGTVIMHHFKK